MCCGKRTGNLGSSPAQAQRHLFSARMIVSRKSRAAGFRVQASQASAEACAVQFRTSAAKGLFAACQR